MITALVLIGLTSQTSAAPAPPLSASPAAPSTAAPDPPAIGTTHYDELLVAISLNGVTVNDSTMVVKDERGMYYARADDVAKWNLVLKGRRSIECNGRHYFALDDFKVSFDANSGLLALTASPTVFGLNIIDLHNVAQQLAQPVLGPGGFINYDIAPHVGTQGADVSGSFNGAYTLLNGVATASAVQPGNGSGFVRLNTTFERDDLAQHTVLRFGDTIEAGGILPLRRQFGGVQWGTDYALSPSFATVALPAFSGALPSDGTLDIIVNGRQVSQQQLPAGPFVLQNLPVAAGSGDVTLVLRDASGRVQTIASPYYQSPILLRQGVSQFELDAGSERQGLGIVSNSYDGLFISAQGRRGVSSQLTLGGAIDGSSQAAMASVAADYLLPVIGQVAATITARTGLDPGVQQAYTYSYQGRNFGLGGQLTKSSPLYREDGCQLPCVAANYQLAVNASAGIGKNASLTLTDAHSIMSDGTPSHTTQFSFARRLGPGSLNFELLRSGPSPTTTTITANFGMPLGPRAYGSLSAVQGNGESGTTVSYDQSMPDTATGFAYHMQAQTSATGGATYAVDATEQLMKQTVTQQLFHGEHTTLFSADIAGSIDFADGEISMARSIGQGFAVVELPYPAVGVYSNGLEVGRTDARGRLILPQLAPYQSTVITLEGNNLPIGVELVTSGIAVTPYGLSPAIARFVVKSDGGVTVTLVDSHGAVLPVGSKIVTDDHKLHWIVAYDGLAYLDGVAAGKQRFTATTATATCSFELLIPKKTTQLPDLGRKVCR